MKPLILAGPVLDITIGRYLAAREVDFILYPMDQQESLVPMLQEWIEGPKFIADIGGNTDPIWKPEADGYFGQVLLDYGGEILIFADLRKGKADDKLMNAAHYFIVSSPRQIQSLNLNPKQCLIDYQNNQDLYKESRGYFIQTGLESAKGIADFEMLDIFFDRLEQEV
jgi:hypothetical protein